MNKDEYKIYLDSFEWKKKAEEVRIRSHGLCERCEKGLADHVHHLTYERVGRELPEDLQAVCKNCHEFLHGISYFDPVVNDYVGEKGKAERQEAEEKIMKYGVVHNGKTYYGQDALDVIRRMT